MSILTAKKPQDVTVKMLMTRKVISVREDFSVPNVAHIISKNDISSVPVLGDSDVIVGFVTISDCFKCMVNCLFHDEIKSKVAKDVMSTDIKSIGENADIFELENFFIQNGIHTAPVVTSSGELVGMISRRDALVGIEKLYAETLKYKGDLKEPLELTLTERMKYLIREYN